jgi:hypothetical protein
MASMGTPLLKKHLVLFILPIIYAFFCIQNTNKLQRAFIRTVDPEYIHLMSSINLAEGNVYIQSIESPATPLYVLGALTAKGTCLVSTSRSLKEDFISNPEKYIRAFRFVLLGLTTLSLFILGFVVLKVSHSILPALLFQLAPFLSIDMMLTSTMATPDHFVVIIMLLYLAVLFYFLHQDNHTGERKWALYFSVFTAIGCATKITFLPLCILPIFILVNGKQRLVYFLSTILLIPLCAFTATCQYERFLQWVEGLIFHTGNYGTGEEKIISTSSFIHHLEKIVSTEIPFIVISFLLVLCVVVMTIKRRKNRYNKIIVGLTCTLLLQIILVSKHFAIRYLTPSILLAILGIYLLMMVCTKQRKMQRIYMLCFIVIYPLFSFKKIYTIHNHLVTYSTSRNGAHEYIEKNIKGKPLLTIPNYFGSATQEYALWFASKWVGKNANDFIGQMNKKCPDTYFYLPEEDKYFNWRNEISLFDILKSYPVLNLYISLDATKKKEKAFGKEVLEKINAYNSPNDSIIKIKYLFHQKYDMICQLNIDIAKLVKVYHFNEAFCNMERISKDKKYYMSDNYARLFKNFYLRTSEKSFSGKFSEKLTKENNYGTGCTIDDVKVGDYFEATIWRRAEDDDYFLVCSAKNPADLYLASKTITEEKKGWKKIKLSISIDKEIVGNKLNFYSWYAGNGTCYCDDFKIVMGRNKISTPK